ncbi:hypothetical protein IQ227_07305 [Anabaena aphanizomenioides LEGE 00250]|uniref:Transposase n=1 Tax=Sphaerospermopsis aphanizomenoides LEGE 00250 TaxID=2777972 RepID=A0ABR9VBJ4_9CYAN|nr:hypothetical protein [Sphaerospermopsis aphanizomenoides]MBE9235848.1 hypothetical protein [Sphaerospermopsis aphanizomenoides LEGE 00250]
MALIKIYLPNKPDLKRGSGRKVKRRSLVSQDALFYAVAYVFYAEQLAHSVGGNPRNWMEFVGQQSADLLLTFGSQDIEDWLTEKLLPYGVKNGNKTRSISQLSKSKEILGW